MPHQSDFRFDGRSLTDVAPLIGLDLFMLVISVICAVAVAPQVGAHPYVWGGAFALVCFLGLRLRGHYRFHLGMSLVDDLGRIIAVSSFAAMTVVSARALGASMPHSGLFGARMWLYSILLLSAGRIGIILETRRLWRVASPPRPTLVVGAGMVGRTLARRLDHRHELGLNPVGYLDDDPRPLSADDLPLLGGVRDLERVITEHGVSHVIITFSLTSDTHQLALMRRCREVGVEVMVVPRLYEQMTRRLTIEHAGGIPLIRAEQPNPDGLQFWIKHAVDRVAAAILLVALTPVLMLLALLIRLSSGGPVLFRQDRVGRDGRSFTMLKFRSMSGSPREAGENDMAWAMGIHSGIAGHDGPVADRTTRVGGVLRKLSLDELPQLINVLRGDMSLVGPRPERVGYVQGFEATIYRYGDRHRVKSGITGWAQVQRLRGETSLADRIEWDNYYIENWSLWFDLRILLLTIPAALFGPIGNRGGADAVDSPEGTQREPRRE